MGGWSGDVGLNSSSRDSSPLLLCSARGMCVRMGMLDGADGGGAGRRAMIETYTRTHASEAVGLGSGLERRVVGPALGVLHARVWLEGVVLAFFPRARGPAQDVTSALSFWS